MVVLRVENATDWADLHETEILYCMKTRSILKQTANCPLIPPDPGASQTALRLYCAFHKHAKSKVQKPLSQLRFSLPSIIITIRSNEPWNRETHKTDRNPQITNHDLLNPWSKVEFTKPGIDDPDLRSTLHENAPFFPQDKKYSVLRLSSWYFSLT